VSPTHIADYAEPAGAVRTKAAGISHNQPGKSGQLAEVVAAFVDQPNPPVRASARQRHGRRYRGGQACPAPASCAVALGLRFD
jgi:hypothetical protein